MIRADHLTKRYPFGGGVTDVSVHLDPGEFVAVTGPRGAGKSTLLRLLAGVTRPDDGTIEFYGTDLAALGDEERRTHLAANVAAVAAVHGGRPTPTSARLVVADDATYDLDLAQRHATLRLLKDLTPGRVVLVATHDPVLIDGADQVLTMEDGKLR